jgi:hypothetical protein
VAQKEHVEDFKRTVMGMSEMLEIIQGEQRYLERKITRHAQTVVRGRPSGARCAAARRPAGGERGVHRGVLFVCRWLLRRPLPPPPCPPQRSNSFRASVSTFCEVAAIAAMCGAQIFTIRRFFSKGTIRLSV